MLNPSLGNVTVYISSNFFPECMIKKYNDWLFHLNSPIKLFPDVFVESIQNITVPGFTTPNIAVENLPNGGRNGFHQGDIHASTMNRFFEGHQPWFNVIEGSLLTLGFRNNIINWMYCYEMLYGRYRRNERVEQFQIIITVHDSADIPMIKYVFSDCWIEMLPALEMSFNASFNETKTFDVGVKFNRYDVEFCIPEFKKTDIDLND